MADDDNRSKTQQIESDGMMRIRVRCVGITPLLHNAMGIDALLAMRDKSARKSKASQPVLQPREECLPKLYLDGDGHRDRPVVPIFNVFACLKEAGRQVRLEGRKQISTARGTVLPSLMTNDSTVLYLFKAKEPRAHATWEVDIRKGTNPNGGEAVVLIRPRFDSWSFTIDIQIYTREVGENAIRRVFDIAGTAIGLCDFRPSRGGTFGRFRVDEWKVL